MNATSPEETIQDLKVRVRTWKTIFIVSFCIGLGFNIASLQQARQALDQAKWWKDHAGEWKQVANHSIAVANSCNGTARDWKDFYEKSIGKIKLELRLKPSEPEPPKFPEGEIY